jgi:hypothetical protein
MNILKSVGSALNYKFLNTSKAKAVQYALYYGSDILRGINYSIGVTKNLIHYSVFYCAGGEGFITYDKETIFDVTETSIVKDITSEELSHFKQAHPTLKFEILYKLLNNIIPNDKKIKIDTDAKTKINDRLNKYTIKTEFNLKGYLEQNRNEPLDNFTRILLPLKFSNLSWYINNQLINNRDYIFILDLFILFDAFIIIENHDRFFYNYIQKIKLTGLTIIDIEFILSLLWIIMDTDINVKDKYEYNATNPDNTKYKLTELNNIFNIIFHLEHANLAGIDKIIGLLKGTGAGIIESFETDLKEFLLSNLNEPYLSNCKKNIHTLTFGQFIANYILNFKDKKPGLSMLYFGSFQRLLDDVISPSGKNPSSQTGGAITVSAIITPIIAVNINRVLNIILSKGFNILSKIDTYGQHYLSFLYTKNITYNELKDKIFNDKYTDSLLYILESTDNVYPYLQSLILTVEFTPELTAKQRSIFMTNPTDSTSNENSKSNYTKPSTNFKPFEYAFKHMKFSMKDEANKTFNMIFILNILSTFVNSWGALAKTYKLIRDTLSSSNNIVVHKYIKLFNSKENIFDAPARVILNIFNNIQKNKKLSTFLRQLILYQIIYTNAYLLVAEYLSFSEDIANIATGRRQLTDTNYKDIRKIAEKVALLLYKKETAINGVNLIANAYLHEDNYLFPNDIPTSKLFKKSVNFNMRREALLELNKIYLSEKINLLKNNTVQNDLESNTAPGTAESQLLVHPEGVRLMDSRSSVGVYDKSAPHGIANNESYYSATNETINVINAINAINVVDAKEDKLVKRNILLNFYKCIFQYNLALTSFDIENILGYRIIDNITICDETKDILDFYNLDPNKYELYMPTELTNQIYFLKY